MSKQGQLILDNVCQEKEDARVRRQAKTMMALPSRDRECEKKQMVLARIKSQEGSWEDGATAGTGCLPWGVPSVLQWPSCLFVVKIERKKLSLSES